MKPYSESLLNHLLAVSSVLAVTLLLVSFRTHINSTSVGLIMVLVILFVAIFAGSSSAFLASIAAMLCFNYFFLPPIGALTIADPQNWVALFVFLVVALTVGQLSARVKRRAREAEASKREIERLYEELRDAFEQASQTEALRRSEA
jgi:two-component system sensor histidine kinase KdpD